MRAGVEPGDAATELLCMQRIPFQVGAIDIGYFEFSACRWPQITCDLQTTIVIKIEAVDSPRRSRFLRLLFQTDRAPVRIEFNNTIALRIPHLIGEDGSALLALRCPAQIIRQSVPIENIVAEYERHAFTPNELSTDNEGLRQSVRTWLNFISEMQAQLRAIAEETMKLRAILWSSDDQNFADTSQHQSRERVIDHRLVIDGQQLLADRHRDRI